MPWPNKNSDGIIPLNKVKDEWGVSLIEADKMLKSVLYDSEPPPIPNTFKAKVIGSFDEGHKIPPDYQDKVDYIKKLMGDGVIGLDQADKLAKKLGVAISMDSNYNILIPATTKPNKIYWHKDAMPISPIAEPVKMLAVYQDIRTTICGETLSIGYNQVLDSSHDYTEAEIRQMLMTGFGKMTDMIINKLKEKKK